MKEYTNEALFDTQSSVQDLFLQTSYPWEILTLLEDFLKKKKGIFSLINQKVSLINKEEIFIGKNVEISSFVVIEGPCCIEDNVRIGPGAYIRKGSFLAENSFVGHASEIKNSILLEGAKAPHRNYVGDSILGKNVNLGAGSVLANVRFDRAEIVLNKIKTSRKKCGAFIGDNAQIGCAVVTSPGTVIAKGVFVQTPGALSGYLGEKKC